MRNLKPFEEYIKNGIKYYGTALEKEYAEKVIEFTKKVYPKLKTDITKQIENLLKSLNIKYYIFTHEPTPTSKDSAKVRKQLKEYNIDEKNGAAAIVLRSKGSFFMCVLPGCFKIDFKKVKKLLGTKSVSLATKEEVEKVTHCIPGGVPPFGNLFNIPLYVDKRLLENGYIAFNAGIQTISIIMESKDYLKATKAIVEDFAI